MILHSSVNYRTVRLDGLGERRLKIRLGLCVPISKLLCLVLNKIYIRKYTEEITKKEEEIKKLNSSKTPEKYTGEFRDKYFLEFLVSGSVPKDS